MLCYRAWTVDVRVSLIWKKQVQNRHLLFYIWAYQDFLGEIFCSQLLISNGYKFCHSVLTIMTNRKNQRLFFLMGLKFIIRLIKSHDFSLKLSQPVLTVTNSWFFLSQLLILFIQSFIYRSTTVQQLFVNTVQLCETLVQLSSTVDIKKIICSWLGKYITLCK